MKSEPACRGPAYAQLRAAAGQFDVDVRKTGRRGLVGRDGRRRTTGAEGGLADFDRIEVHQPHPHGLVRPIPYGRSIRLASFHATTGLAASRGDRLASGVPTRFEIVDRKLGRVALRSSRRFVTLGEVVSKHGASAMAEFLLGMLTRRLLAESKCDLMVLPRTAVEAIHSQAALVSQRNRLAASTANPLPMVPGSGWTGDRQPFAANHSRRPS